MLFLYNPQDVKSFTYVDTRASATNPYYSSPLLCMSLTWNVIPLEVWSPISDTRVTRISTFVLRLWPWLCILPNRTCQGSMEYLYERLERVHINRELR